MHRDVKRMYRGGLGAAAAGRWKQHRCLHRQDGGAKSAWHLSPHPHKPQAAVVSSASGTRPSPLPHTPLVYSATHTRYPQPSIPVISRHQPPPLSPAITSALWNVPGGSTPTVSPSTQLASGSFSPALYMIHMI
eukprot:366149-Chlamydomonas_euryale.AAC.8